MVSDNENDFKVPDDLSQGDRKELRPSDGRAKLIINRKEVSGKCHSGLGFEVSGDEDEPS